MAIFVGTGELNRWDARKKDRKIQELRGLPERYAQAMDPFTAGIVTIRQFGDMSEALLAQGALDAAGIESFLADTNIARVEWPMTRGMRLQVDVSDCEAAEAILTETTLVDGE